MQLLYAASYEIRGRQQAGKIHAIKEDERTYCGTELRYTDGHLAPGERGTVSCKGCMRSLDSQDKYEEQKQDWEQRATDLARQRQEDDEQWWAWYTEYLKSAEWAQRRHMVLNRAKGRCEGCLKYDAVHVHHTTYVHAGNELLFELVALCQPCHQIAHPNKVI